MSCIILASPSTTHFQLFRLVHPCNKPMGSILAMYQQTSNKAIIKLSVLINVRSSQDIDCALITLSH